MKICDVTDQELMAVRSVERGGNQLVIRGKMFGAMPMIAKITPAEARASLKLFDFRTMMSILSLLFRRG